MTRAFEKADEQVREELRVAMAMPVETEEEKGTKILSVKAIYNKLGVEEEAKKGIQQLHEQALGYVSALGLEAEAEALLTSYASKLIGRSK